MPAVRPLWWCQAQVGAEVLPSAHSSDQGINEANSRLLTTARAEGYNAKPALMASRTKTQYTGKVTNISSRLQHKCPSK